MKKTGLQPVSRPVERILRLFPKVLQNYQKGIFGWRATYNKTLCSSLGFDISVILLLKKTMYTGVGIAGWLSCS